MSRVRVDEDIRPLSEFRAGVATFVKQLHENRRPMVLTQRGRCCTGGCSRVREDARTSGNTRRGV